MGVNAIGHLAVFIAHAGDYSMAPPIIILTIGEALMMTHVIKAVKTTHSSYDSAKTSNREISFNLSPVFVPKGGGLNFSLYF